MLQQPRDVTHLLPSNVNSRFTGSFIPLPFEMPSRCSNCFNSWPIRLFDGTTEGLKEYTIGVEAFGRKQDFDPKTDTIVRVQIHRLRQKLKEYYDAEGSRDPILIEIPKGHYLPSFESATAAGGRSQP